MSQATTEPTPTYDLVAIGGGTTGLVSAFGAAGLGARAAIIERDRLGGDCLNVGCVPSKALLRSARAVRELRGAATVGVRSTDPQVDFAAVMARIRERRAIIAPHDSAERLAAAGVDVFIGEAAFAGPREIVIRSATTERRIRFRRAVIATGSRPSIPSISGLDAATYHTNETIFDITAQPRRLLVLGAGPIGCELAQAFALLGSDVTVTDVADRPLPREDADASTVVRRSLERDGVRFQLGAPVDIAALQRSAAPSDLVLIATGRTPNVEHLHLEAAGVRYNKDGVEVNDRLQTANARIFAAGDVASPFKFTHAADAMARIVIRNALFFGRAKVSALVIPWCTYTMPEVARVGELKGDAITIPLADVDRAVVDSDTDGFLRVHHTRGRIRGCTIVAPHAGELIGHVAHVMRIGGGLGDLSDVVFPYPTYAEALRKAGDAYRRTLLTPNAKSLLQRYFRFVR